MLSFIKQLTYFNRFNCPISRLQSELHSRFSDPTRPAGPVSGHDPTHQFKLSDPTRPAGPRHLRFFLLFATLVQVGYTHKLGNKQIRHLFIHFLLYGHIHLTTHLFVTIYVVYEYILVYLSKYIW